MAIAFGVCMVALALNYLDQTVGSTPLGLVILSAVLLGIYATYRHGGHVQLYKLYCDAEYHLVSFSLNHPQIFGLAIVAGLVWGLFLTNQVNQHYHYHYDHAHH